MKIGVILLAVLSISLAGCGEPRLDGSSNEAMRASVEKVKSELKGEKLVEFREAMKVIGLSMLGPESPWADVPEKERPAGGILAQLDGKSASEVIARADVIRAERAARVKAQALEEIAELESQVANAEKAKTELAKFAVSRSRFAQETEQYSSRKKPIIELSVMNGTSHPISRAYFRGTIASPGRSIPWLSDDFNYQIAGGLEPGEKADWSLAPNMFSDWGKVEAPSDAVFTVEVVRLDGPDGKAILDASGLSPRQLERLAKLKSQYPNS